MKTRIQNDELPHESSPKVIRFETHHKVQSENQDGW